MRGGGHYDDSKRYEKIYFIKNKNIVCEEK